MRKEISKVVYLRSFLCILVVVGHIVARWKMTDKYSVPVNRSLIFPYISEFINSFHMSLFFALSGFLYCFLVSENRKYNKFPEFLLNKFKRLIIPFLFTAIIFAPIVFFTTGKQNSVLIIIKDIITGRRGYHLWYLPTLFHIFVISMFAGKVLIKERKILNICVLANLFIVSCWYYIFPSVFYIRETVTYLFFFWAGYYAKLYWSSIRKSFCQHTMWIIVACLLAFVIGNIPVNAIIAKRIKTCVVDYLVVNIFLLLYTVKLRSCDSCIMWNGCMYRRTGCIGYCTEKIRGAGDDRRTPCY